MVTFMAYEDNYYEMCGRSEYKTVIYGAGIHAVRAFPYLKNICCVCDKKAEEIKAFKTVKAITPGELEGIKEKVFIVICIKSESVRAEVKTQLGNLNMDACVFDYFDNCAFDIYKDKKLHGHDVKRKIHHVHLIYEDKGWILEKFAVRMKAELEKQGYYCTIDNMADPLADINHHVIYASCEPAGSGNGIEYNETFMITHIDSFNKVEFLKHQLRKAKMGICMSRETMERLAVYGVPREKLCYINPAQDGVIKPKKYILGITHKIHDDHRKNVNILVELCKELNPDYFAFKIMGAGWEYIVSAIRDMGFQTDYYNEFHYEEYTKLMPTLDYYLFWGFDEGSMGYLDALRAGVETIVTPQGYHLDVKDGISYACRTAGDFKEVLLNLQQKRYRLVKSVEDWTWENYVKKHIEVWNYLLGNEESIYKNQHLYEDGIFSVLKYNS